MMVNDLKIDEYFNARQHPHEEKLRLLSHLEGVVFQRTGACTAFGVRCRYIDCPSSSPPWLREAVYQKHSCFIHPTRPVERLDADSAYED